MKPLGLEDWSEGIILKSHCSTFKTANQELKPVITPLIGITDYHPRRQPAVLHFKTGDYSKGILAIAKGLDNHDRELGPSRLDDGS